MPKVNGPSRPNLEEAKADLALLLAAATKEDLLRVAAQLKASVKSEPTRCVRAHGEKFRCVVRVGKKKTYGKVRATRAEASLDIDAKGLRSSSRFYDEETEIPKPNFKDVSKISHEVATHLPYELRHRRENLLFTTVSSDMCERAGLADLFLRAANIGALRRKAKEEEAAKTRKTRKTRIFVEDEEDAKMPRSFVKEEEGCWRAYVFLPAGEEVAGPKRLNHEDAEDDLRLVLEAEPENVQGVAAAIRQAEIYRKQSEEDEEVHGPNQCPRGSISPMYSAAVQNRACAKKKKGIASIKN